MDKFEQIAAFTEFPVAILGNLDSSELVLVDASKNLTSDEEQSLAKRGMRFVGVAGVGTDGTPQTALAVPLSKADTDILAAAYLQHIGAVVRSRVEAKALEGWLTRLSHEDRAQAH
jgi:hypothetical protein